MRFKPLLLILAFLSPGIGGAVFAHATLVLGTVSSNPTNPQPGGDFELSLSLENPTGLEVEDAIVYAEFRPPGAALERDPVRRAQLEETSPGVYTANLNLPSAGEWSLYLRDQTFRQEEATAELTFAVGDAAAPGVESFVFPPTATSSSSLWVWLGWLIGLPIIAAVVVTVIVLTGGKKEPQNVSS